MVKMAKNSTIRITIESGYDQWWRYNVYVSAATFADGERVDYRSVCDVVYPLGNGSEVRLRPEGWNPARPIVLEIDAAQSLELFAYVIPNTMPIDNSIRQSPPFPIRLKINGAGLNISEDHKVNQWGGLSLHGTY